MDEGPPVPLVAAVPLVVGAAVAVADEAVPVADGALAAVDGGVLALPGGGSPMVEAWVMSNECGGARSTPSGL